jgi:N-acetylmuramic acid 6-phosphate (MurNAc-6-P) etherase
MNKLYKDTNQKFIERVENMLYYVCGCNKKRGREVLEECLKRNKEKK